MSYDVDATEDWIFIPVSDPTEVPADLDIVEHEAPPKETQSMPADLLGFEPSYERLGDIVIIDEDEEDRAREVAQAIMESDIKAATVVNRASKIKGIKRVRDWEVLAGDGTETVHREYGTEFLVDISEVYFSPRLATERHRVISQVEAGEHVFDMFAGVGPFAVPMAQAGGTVVATDINEVAVKYLEENAARNSVEESITPINGDVREVATEYRGWADRVVMNLPHSAQEFLDTAVDLAGEACTLHYYDIQPDTAPFEPGETAIREAAGNRYDVEVLTRREVRTYAPHEVNVVLDVSLTEQ